VGGSPRCLPGRGGWVDSYNNDEKVDENDNHKDDKDNNDADKHAGRGGVLRWEAVGGGKSKMPSWQGWLG